MKTRGKGRNNAQSKQSKQVSKQLKPSKTVEKNANKKVKKSSQKKQQPQPVAVVEEKKQKEQEVKEQKKALNPKKYLKKNYDQLSRIARSKYQKIYLLEAKRDDEDGWNFTVQGASGSNYRVHVHNSGLKCTCIDFRMKQKPCKHIYFIVTQVAQNEQFLDYFNNSTKISKAAYTLLDEQLLSRLKSRLEPQKKESKDIDLKDDTDCTICFTEMVKQTQSLEDCGQCKKYFHFDCITAWKKHNPTCPLCRGKLMGNGNINDPLGLLSNIQIVSQNTN